MATKSRKKSFKIGTDIDEITKQHYSKAGQQRKKRIDRNREALAYHGPGLVRFKGDWKVAIIATITVIIAIFLLALLFVAISR